MAPKTQYFIGIGLMLPAIAGLVWVLADGPVPYPWIGGPVLGAAALGYQVAMHACWRWHAARCAKSRPSTPEARNG